MVATYIGVALYIVLYAGYTVYERYFLRRETHFVPLTEVDLITDAVWGPGEGDAVRARDLEEKTAVGGESGTAGRVCGWVKAL